MGLERNLTQGLIPIDARDDHAQILIGQLVLELLAPFEQTRALIPQHVENTRVLELKGVLQAVQVKVKQRNAAAVMYGHKGERGARDGMAVTQAGRNALGEMRLSHTQSTRQNEHIAVLQAAGDQLAQVDGVIHTRTCIRARSPILKRHGYSSISGSALAVASFSGTAARAAFRPTSTGCSARYAPSMRKSSSSSACHAGLRSAAAG